MKWVVFRWERSHSDRQCGQNILHLFTVSCQSWDAAGELQLEASVLVDEGEESVSHCFERRSCWEYGRPRVGSPLLGNRCYQYHPYFERRSGPSGFISLMFLCWWNASSGFPFEFVSVMENTHRHRSTVQARAWDLLDEGSGRYYFIVWLFFAFIGYCTGKRWEMKGKRGGGGVGGGGMSPIQTRPRTRRVTVGTRTSRPSRVQPSCLRHFVSITNLKTKLHHFKKMLVPVVPIECWSNWINLCFCLGIFFKLGINEHLVCWGVFTAAWWIYPE